MKSVQEKSRFRQGFLPGAAPGKAKLPAKRGRNKGAKVFADIRQVEYDADLFVRGALRAQPPPPRGKPLGKPWASPGQAPPFLGKPLSEVIANTIKRGV